MAAPARRGDGLAKAEVALAAPKAIADLQAPPEYDPGGGCTGLNNLGNTCFLNSGLQALMCVPQLARSLVELEYTAYRVTSSRSPTIATAMAWLARTVWSGEHDVISPSQVLSTLRRVNRMFAGYRQHDSHEALRFILSDMHDTLAQPHYNWTSSIDAASPVLLSPVALASPAAASASAQESPLLAATAAQDSAAEPEWGAPSSTGRDATSVASSSASASPHQAAPVSAVPVPVTDVSDDARVVDPGVLYHWANGSAGSAGALADRSPPHWCRAGAYRPVPHTLRSPVSDAFEGVSCSRVRCRTCLHESVTFTTFMDLSLHIPDAPHPSADAGTLAAAAAPTAKVRRHGFPRPASRRSGWCSFGWADRSITLQDCLHTFCEPDALEGDERYRCDRCGCLRDADKATTIAKLPEVLCVHLNRFSHSGMWGKLSTRVTFPITGLDMKPFVWRDAVNAAEGIVRAKHSREEAAAAAAAREWRRRRRGAGGSRGGADEAPPGPPPVLTDTPFSDDLAARMVSEARQAAALKAAAVGAGDLSYGASPGEGPTQYELVSLVQHMGSMGGGHYVAYGKHQLSGQWLCFNDARVSRTSPEGVAGQEAYILFYSRVRSAPTARLSMPLPPPDGRPRDSSRIHCWLSAQWWLRRRLFACPGPITSYDVACPHGRLSRHLREAATDALTGKLEPLHFLIPVTEAQFAVLVATHGRHGPVILDLADCPACKSEAKALAARRRAEATAIAGVDSKSLPASGHVDAADQYWHLIGSAWVKRWHAFKDNGETGLDIVQLPLHDCVCYRSSDELFVCPRLDVARVRFCGRADATLEDGTGRGALPPGPVDNSSLLRANGSPRGNLRAAVHFRGVNGSVWQFFHGLYGGGPRMRRRRKIDIYEEPVDPIPPDLLGSLPAGSAPAEGGVAAGSGPAGSSGRGHAEGWRGAVRGVKAVSGVSGGGPAPQSANGSAAVVQRPPGLSAAPAGAANSLP